MGANPVGHAGKKSNIRVSLYLFFHERIPVRNCIKNQNIRIPQTNPVIIPGNYSATLVIIGTYVFPRKQCVKVVYHKFIRSIQKHQEPSFLKFKLLYTKFSIIPRYPKGQINNIPLPLSKTFNSSFSLSSQERVRVRYRRGLG